MDAAGGRSGMRRSEWTVRPVGMPDDATVLDGKGWRGTGGDWDGWHVSKRGKGGILKALGFEDWSDWG